MDKVLHWIRAHPLQSLAIALAVAVVPVAVVLRSHLITTEGIGYPAILVISLLGSATILVPIPAIASVCTGGAVLSPALVGLVAAVGGTLGESTGYLAGYGGRSAIQNSQRYARIAEWMRRRGWLVLLVLAAVPNPFFDFAGIAAGALRYPLWRFYAIVFVGKLAKNIGIAYACTLGWDVLIRFIPE